MSLFPEDDRARKMLPVWKMETRYFPKALREVTRVCVANNVRYNPERDPTDIHWARGKSPDQLGSAHRHMQESEVDGKVFETVSEAVTKATGIERVYVLAEASWRLLAALELAIEAEEAKVYPIPLGQDAAGYQVTGYGNPNQAAEPREVYRENDRLEVRPFDEYGREPRPPREGRHDPQGSELRSDGAASLQTPR